jgi:hypothetical protein
MRNRAFVLVAVAAVACLGPSGPDDRPSAVPLAASPSPALFIEFTDMAHGHMAFRTLPDASCRVLLNIQGGQHTESAAPVLSEAQSGPTGQVRVTYPTSRVPAQTATVHVDCDRNGSRADARSEFRIELRRVRAADLIVSVRVAQPGESGGVPEDPDLVSLRDATTDLLRAELPRRWRLATRGLGDLKIVDVGADIVIRVHAGQGQSAYRRARDGTHDIILMVADPGGFFGLENRIPVALHELGHIWCCRSAGTDGSHWLEPLADPRLTGIDRFGLMGHPVLCIRAGPTVSCPDRFSERELLELGFVDIPPP